MAFEDSVYLHLKNNTAVAAIISTRLYPLVIPQDVDLPAIAYQVIGELPDYSHDGRGNNDVRVQFTCQGSGNDYSGARDLARAVRNAFDSWPGATVENMIDSWAEGFEAAVVRVDVVIRQEIDET